jgi:hypothetical protein
VSKNSKEALKSLNRNNESDAAFAKAKELGYEADHSTST